jgi:hypothetical protein
MAKPMIRFINANDPSEIISVNDQESAFILTRVLPKHWSIEGQAPAVVEAPVAEAAAAATSVEEIPTAAPAPAAAVTAIPASEFRVILISGTSTFRCATCEVALDHATLKNAAPAAFCGKECTAYISHHDMKENIEISCNVVTDSTGATRLEFVHPAKPELERLSEWMGATA